jgi:predicted dehydrogenase
MKIPEARIAAIAGRNQGRAEELASSATAAKPTAGSGYERPRVYPDWGEMLAKEELDAVFILLPPHLHGDLEIACAGRVPAVLVEKPLANELAIARRVLEAFDTAGTFAAAAYMNRCRRSVARTRELFSGPEDAPVLVEGRWVTPLPPPSWWRNKSLSGGQFVEQCTHLVDIARFVAGEIVEVSAFPATGHIDDVEGFTADDAMVVSARFASGALGQFSTGCFPRRDFAAVGGIGMEFGSRSARCRLSGWGMELRAEFESGGTETIAPEEDIFEVEDRLFLLAAAKGEPGLFPSSYADAVETLRVTLAANESAASGKALRLG